MLYEQNETASELKNPVGSQVIEPLPAMLVVTERAVAALRAYLMANELDHFVIFHPSADDLHDLDRQLKPLGENAAWEELAIGQGEPLAILDSNAAHLSRGGVLRLSNYHVVVARWQWIRSSGDHLVLCLGAAPSTEHYLRFKRDLEARRHEDGASVWQIVRGSPYNDGERVPRDMGAGEELLLEPQLRRRIDLDVIRFFDPQVAALYRSMQVPYRRGVLLHGPPGNGKTSTIRYIGASLPKVPAMILRPDASFDVDDLEEVINRWRRQVPAILVIEDLNWLLEKVNVSTFLNLVDGIESRTTGGLMLIATTNHPYKLDPAINNRPGRFDVVIEMPCPGESLRLEFFRRRLGGMDVPVLEKLATTTNELSFAHLQEVLRLSGLMAIQGGRTERSEQDLLSAAETVRTSHEDAERGFAIRPEAPFGLAAWQRREKRVDA